MGKKYKIKSIKSNQIKNDTFRKHNDYGKGLNRNQGNSGRPRTARSAANIQNVRRSLQGIELIQLEEMGLGCPEAPLALFWLGGGKVAPLVDFA